MMIFYFNFVFGLSYPIVVEYIYMKLSCCCKKNIYMYVYVRVYVFFVLLYMYVTKIQEFLKKFASLSIFVRILSKLLNQTNNNHNNNNNNFNFNKNNNQKITKTKNSFRITSFFSRLIFLLVIFFYNENTINMMSELRRRLLCDLF